MTDQRNPENQTAHSRRSTKATWPLRWAACSVVVLGVFIGARITMNDDSGTRSDPAADQSVRDSAPPPSRNGQDIEDDKPFDERDGSDDGSGDSVMEDLEQSTDIWLGNDDGEEPAPEAEEGSTEYGWAQTTGTSAAGDAWAISYPEDWEIGAEPGVDFVVSSPSAPIDVGIKSWRSIGPLPEEAQAGIEALEAEFGVEADEVEVTEVDGRSALRTTLRVETARGVWHCLLVVWVQTGDTSYALMAEFPEAEAELETDAEQTIRSFRASETV